MGHKLLVTRMRLQLYSQIGFAADQIDTVGKTVNLEMLCHGLADCLNVGGGDHNVQVQANYRLRIGINCKASNDTVVCANLSNLFFTPNGCSAI
ncbi:MAG: hypothetical protein JSV60_07215 [Desulfobacterales bacterium]|nr:MAG: hypothetical protein JSV60_07215 [Desulfobacterales bacterium]